jgi:RNA polymerase sigma factor (sigma-70 family)
MEHALTVLCTTYWYPVYAYARRQGHNPEEAKDLTQEFFARLIAKNYLGLAAPELGRFRTFLLSSFQRFMINEWRREHRQKRGGANSTLSLDQLAAEERFSAEPADPLDPEKIYEKHWAATLLENVLVKLRADYARGGRAVLFDALKDYLWGERNLASHAEAAVALGLSTGAVKVASHRLRDRFRDLLRAEIAHTVVDPAEVDEELRHLIAVISG